MDIVEVDGNPPAKRGKWSGSKRVIACARCGERKIIPKDNYGSSCSCGASLMISCFRYRTKAGSW